MIGIKNCPSLLDQVSMLEEDFKQSHTLDLKGPMVWLILSTCSFTVQRQDTKWWRKWESQASRGYTVQGKNLLLKSQSRKNW